MTKVFLLPILDKPLELLLFLIVSSTIFFIIRIFPIWPHRNRGCDAYYFLLCAKTLKENKKLPITLPGNYIAEYNEQWYPPLFSIILALVPYKWLHSYHWAINHILDFLVAFLIFIIGSYFIGYLGASILVVLYALQPAIISEYITLTSRPLGLILQTVCLIAGYFFITTSSLISACICVISITILIYSHKLSLQLIWFLFPFFSLVYLDIRWISLLLAGYVTAFLIWPQMFIKVKRAHLDIVKFWSKNWPLLGAHPIEQSPIYGDSDSGLPYYKRPEIKSPTSFLKMIIQSNVFIIFFPIGLALAPAENELATFLSLWIVGIYAWALITHFLPQFRGLGLAQQYIKFSFIPVMGFTCITINDFGTFWLYLFLCLAGFILTRWYFKAIKITLPEDLSDNIKNITNFLNEQKDPRVMVFPYHHADELAFKSKAKVLWGTHTFSFDGVKDFFPVLNKPLIDLFKKFNITHLVIQKGYTSAECLGISEKYPHKKIGSFEIYEISTDIFKK